MKKIGHIIDLLYYMSILYVDIIYRYYLKLILNNIQKTKPYYNQQSTINNQQSTPSTPPKP